MKKLLLSATAMLLLSSVVLAQNIQFVEYKMDNGLKVLLHEDHSTPIVAVSVMYHVGSKNEKPKRSGFAHFFEHLLFEGSENIARGEFDDYINNAGGYNNANTWYDRLTMRCCPVISWHLDSGLKASAACSTPKVEGNWYWKPSVR
ncbi:MAG: insulinase family protein [Saprospiraceae bacterium]